MNTQLVLGLLAWKEGWKVGGHVLRGSWLDLLGDLVLAALLAGYVFLLARALVRRHWYRAEGVLGAEDLAAVHAALAAAERRTVGEILPVVLERSDRHPGAAWLAALTAALIGSATLAPWLPWDRPAVVLATQLALGALGWASARLLPDFLRAFVSEARAEEMAAEQAVQEFHRHALDRTEGRTGVLLFVSLLERRALVLADEGIHARVAPEQWANTNALVLEGLRRGSLREGLVAAIASAGAVLAEHFPVAGGDRNEVPDRVIVRRE
jgi:putative membrane protein